MKTLRKWDITDKFTQDKCINEVITRIQEIEDGAVGLIAAQDIIDIVAEHLGPEIYNKAIQDAIKLVENRMRDTETELDMLQVKA